MIYIERMIYYYFFVLHMVENMVAALSCKIVPYF